MYIYYIIKQSNIPLKIEFNFNELDLKKSCDSYITMTTKHCDSNVNQTRKKTISTSNITTDSDDKSIIEQVRKFNFRK
jgi:hypothetical protein